MVSDETTDLSSSGGGTGDDEMTEIVTTRWTTGALVATVALTAVVGTVGVAPAQAAAPDAVVVRVAGDDRFSTAVRISQSVFSDDETVGPVVDEHREARVVYLASGRGFADALSAAPAAAHLGGPLLLSDTGGVPAVVLAEIVRLDPERVVVVGGEAALAPRVVDQVEHAVPDAVVDRVFGDDRFATSRAISSDAFLDDTWQLPAVGRPRDVISLYDPVDYTSHDVSFDDGALFVATGRSFPDALAASAAAGAHDMPLVLVPGEAASLDAPTRDLIADLDPGYLYPVGGPAVMSQGIVDDLRRVAPVDGTAHDVVRLAGDDRYETSHWIGSTAFSTHWGLPYGVDHFTETSVFVASGENFPDALAGAAAAGYLRQPLFTSRAACMPSPTYHAVDFQRPDEIVLLGGRSALADRVADTRRLC